VKKIKMSSI